MVRRSVGRGKAFGKSGRIMRTCKVPFCEWHGDSVGYRVHRARAHGLGSKSYVQQAQTLIQRRAKRYGAK